MNRPNPYEENFSLDIWENWTWNPWTAFKRWMGTADTEELKREVERLKAIIECNHTAIDIARRRGDHYKQVLSKIQLVAHNGLRYKDDEDDGPALPNLLKTISNIELAS